MATHVFIVNDQTFKVHLEYMFAGTGAGEKLPSFLLEANSSYNASTERNLVGMIADISRLRAGDEVVFYLTGCAKFYGFFKVKKKAFADVTGAYLIENLGKRLTFRVLLEPDIVYADGVTEHEYLDNLDGISAPYEMCWSLIYRKLKGNRGCTAIFNYEATVLKRLIQNKNNYVALVGRSFSYDNVSDKITATALHNNYDGIIQSIAIKERLLNKANGKKAFEVHLQAFLMQHFEQLATVLNIPHDCWFANEVSCGVGMQRIDIMTVSETTDTVDIKIIELKHHIPSNDIIQFQLPWYVKWCSDYVVPNFPNKRAVITPVVLAHIFNDNQSLIDFHTFADSRPLSAQNATISPTQFVSFAFDKDNITFKKEF
ncbi:MAG: hypothetical protein LBN00_07475 [Oscillospiraceae bacterium]|jgi:hypothetical protein|nr:hypothetical protein [Oscillospiraceae bacterium]